MVHVSLNNRTAVFVISLSFHLFPETLTIVIILLQPLSSSSYLQLSSSSSCHISSLIIPATYFRLKKGSPSLTFVTTVDGFHSCCSCRYLQESRPSMAFKNQVMEQERAVLSIAFKPLLDQICSFLGLPSPIFHSCPAGVHSCYVIVCGPNEPHSFVFFGGEKKNFEESAENASRKMVVFLVKRFKLRVDDINLSELDEYEVACAAFRLKRRQLECVEKGEDFQSLEEEMALSLVGKSPAAISIDFYLLLGVVVGKFKVCVTNVEYVYFGAGCCKALLSVVTSNNVTDAKWIQSEICSSIGDAKQSLAKKALSFLKSVYKFEVQDVNYHLVSYASALCMLERETCSTMKERIHGVKENASAHPVLEEELPVTPKGVEFRIPTTLPLPRPPKKRRYHSTSSHFSNVIPDVMIPAELETVIPRRRNP